MQLGLDDRAVMDEPFTRHFDTCLGCMACVTACPSGVQYDHLIEATRPQIERHATRGAADRWFRRLIFALFPYPTRLRFVAVALWAYQNLGIQSLLRSSGLLERLPSRLKAMEGIAPPVTQRSIFGSVPSLVPAQGERRRRVGLLLGCVQRTFFPNVNDATVRVLTAEGCEVVVPAQGCCGALMMHAGLEDDAIAMAKRLIDAFEGIDVDTIVINAAGCGSTLKTYGHLLRDEPDYAERATTLAAKCKDVSEVLAELSPRAPRHPLPLSVAYHDACHLQHAQGVTAEPRDVLAAIPELDVLEIPEAGLCCGSAGIYNLVEPEAARELGVRQAKNVLSTGAAAVVSSNPGCLLQLQSAMNDDTFGPMPSALPMYHLVEVVDASIRGLPLLTPDHDQN
jgi:glycolate oxidase iron-sulfur subunit